VHAPLGIPLCVVDVALKIIHTTLFKVRFKTQESRVDKTDVGIREFQCMLYGKQQVTRSLAEE
jgi:hypothetical protein